MNHRPLHRVLVLYRLRPHSNPFWYIQNAHPVQRSIAACVDRRWRWRILLSAIVCACRIGLCTGSGTVSIGPVLTLTDDLQCVVASRLSGIAWLSVRLATPTLSLTVFLHQSLSCVLRRMTIQMVVKIFAIIDAMFLVFWYAAVRSHQFYH